MELKHRKTSYLRRFLFLCIFLLIITFWLTGCQKENLVGLQPVVKNSQALHKKAIPPSFTGIDVKAPITIEQGEFNTISGWLNNETIIYTTNVGLGSNVYTYNIYTGKNQLILESEAPVASVMASPSGDRILVHSTPTTYEGILSIIDTDGQLLMNERLEAFDFVFEWNPYDENIILVSLFTEKWDFQTFKMNIAEKKLTEIPLKEPFANWVNKDELVYLDWSTHETALFAPLMKKSLSKTEENKILNDIFHVMAVKNKLTTITVDPDNEKEAVYTFYSNDFSEIASFSIPHLTRFSDWLIPYYDFDEGRSFFTFEPLFSTEADTYDKGFQLISFDIMKGEKKVILDHLNNEPLSCSPDGKLCLYGFYFEKLINMDTKEIVPLITN